MFLPDNLLRTNVLINIMILLLKELNSISDWQYLRIFLLIIFRLFITSIYLSQAIEGMKNTKCYCCLLPSSFLHTPSAWVNIDKEREKCQEKRTSFDLPSKSSALVNTPREKCRGWPFELWPAFLSSRPMSVYGLWDGISKGFKMQWNRIVSRILVRKQSYH